MLKSKYKLRKGDRPVNDFAHCETVTGFSMPKLGSSAVSLLPLASDFSFRVVVQPWAHMKPCRTLITLHEPPPLGSCFSLLSPISQHSISSPLRCSPPDLHTTGLPLLPPLSLDHLCLCSLSPQLPSTHRNN